MRTRTVLATTALLLCLSGCAGASPSSAESPATPTSSGADFPVTITSCGRELTFDKAPSRVLMLSGTGAAIMDELGVLDTVVAHAGRKRFGEAAGDLDRRVDAIPALDSVEGETGGAQVSTEAVLSVEPDLVMGFDTGVQVEALAAAGVPVYSPAAFCPDYDVKRADWSLVDNEFEQVAGIFGVRDRLPEVLAGLHAQVQGLKPAGIADGTTAAALYVTPGSTTFYAYGTSSMVQPIMEAVGLTNAYGTSTERVFDTTMETLLALDPEWLVLLPNEASDEAARQTLRSFPGSEQLRAVREGHVVVLPFALTDPPSSLSVRGAVELSKAVSGA
ncbi:ABC transporter substrate-binding protein [uncultured Tessaracoccus sp.]|uniref:ABC transporter substrate-binding protein n=1 Tax=uncultured Tessaracoccus sp. TaxID=905023 RepID=UPI0025F199B7|nr:ABC transporter substrate-binding protein [uncultured Tessaracoccus sp.]